MRRCTTALAVPLLTLSVAALTLITTPEAANAKPRLTKTRIAKARIAKAQVAKARSATLLTTRAQCKARTKAFSYVRCYKCIGNKGRYLLERDKCVMNAPKAKLRTAKLRTAKVRTAKLRRAKAKRKTMLATRAQCKAHTKAFSYINCYKCIGNNGRYHLERHKCVISAAAAKAAKEPIKLTTKRQCKTYEGRSGRLKACMACVRRGGSYLRRIKRCSMLRVPRR